ncbi:MAG: hypothetical protein KA746_05455 [Pyrinomonadaceae bacterium]|nr:hypothetical protein [Pyrinomonadaceae bacterium]
METENYRSSDLVEYLLGSSSTTMIERFDELSITNDIFADDLLSAEHELIDDYIQSQLDQDTCERFERHYLSSPLRRERVEFARSLKVVAERAVGKMPDSSERWTLAGLFANFSPAIRIAFASIILIAVGTFGWMFLSNYPSQPIEVALVTDDPESGSDPVPASDKLPQQIPSNFNTGRSVEPPTPEPTVAVSKPKVTLATFILPAPKRDGGQLKVITIPANTTDLSFGLLLEPGDASSFNVTLADQSGRVLWRSGTVRPRANAISVRFPVTLIRSDIYTFSVSGINDDGTSENTGNYSFRAVLK